MSEMDAAIFSSDRKSSNPAPLENGLQGSNRGEEVEEAEQKTSDIFATKLRAKIHAHAQGEYCDGKPGENLLGNGDGVHSDFFLLQR